MAKPTFYNQEVIKKYLAAGFWKDISYQEILDGNAENIPDEPALADSRNELTWLEVKRQVDNIALSLLDLGIKREDTIVLQLPNIVDCVTFSWACDRAGIQRVLAPRTLRQSEMEYVLNYLSAKGIVTSWEFAGFDYFKMVQDLQPKVPTLKHVFTVGGNVPRGTLSVERMKKGPFGKKYSVDDLKKTRFGAFEVPSFMMTTGSTGQPKFVELPTCARVCTAERVIELLKLTSRDIMASIGPLSGSVSHLVTFFTTPLTGAKAVLLEKWDPEEALKLIQKEKATVALLVPTQLAKMLSHPNFGKYDLSSLRCVLSGGAALAPPLATRFEKITGAVVVDGFGASETSIAMQSVDDPIEVRRRNVGRPMKGIEIKLVDGYNREVKTGDEGEIVVKGPEANSGYYRNLEATMQTWTKDGWIATGDIGKMDDQGYLTLVGRKKDIIIRGGQNICPWEIEEKLSAHPKVAEVAVVAIPDEIMGEKACAFVVLKDGQQLTFDEIVSFLKSQKIATYKLPERLEILDKLPLLGDQKINKIILRKNMLQKLSVNDKLRN